MIKGRIIGCSYGGVWYEPPGYFGDYAIASPRRSWFESKDKAEAYCEEIRNKLKAEIMNLQLRLEAV